MCKNEWELEEWNIGAKVTLLIFLLKNSHFVKSGVDAVMYENTLNYVVDVLRCRGKAVNLQGQ